MVWVLPEVARRLPPLLAQLDAYLHDAWFFEPFPAQMASPLCSNGNLRLMVVEYRSRLGMRRCVPSSLA